MKKRAIRFLLGFLYVCLVALLLLVHIQRITGDVHRTLATIETLVLAAFTAGVLGLYVKATAQKESSRAEEGEKAPVPERFEDFAKRVGKLSAGKPKEEALSQRELEVAWLLYRGYTNRQVGEELYIAETTVKKHASHIYEKLKVSGKKELRDKIMEK